MRRLSVIDGIFLRTHQGMGTPIALQGLWRTADLVDPARLDRLHNALRAGPLGRRVVRSGIPGARDRWQPSVRAHPLDTAPAPLPADRILPWADGRGADLDPRHGPGWRLSAAPLTDGGTVVALTCSHVLADARGLMIAVQDALGAMDENDTNFEHRPDRGNRSGDPRQGGDRASDWADAAEIWTTVLAGTVRAARTRLRRPRELPRRPPGGNRPHRETASGHVRGTRNSATGPGARDGGHRTGDGRAPASGSGDQAGPPAGLPVPAIVLRCRGREWDRTAAASDGTANSLFIWFVANTLWAAGFPEHGIVASLPVDTRDEPRIDNDLAMTEIVVSPGDGPGEIRAQSRAAYERRITSPGGLPEEFLHLVPDRLAYLLSRGAGERDILCSNIGTIPSRLHALGPHECTGVAARAIHPGLTHARRPRTRLSGYLCRFRGDYLLTLASLDPARLPGPAELHRFAAATARRIGLPLMPW